MREPKVKKALAGSQFYRRRIGILGGGQLGKMLCSAAANWHLETHVLDPKANCPAGAICNNLAAGDYTDFNAVYKFGRSLDIITIEIENVNTDALLKLESEGKKVYPSPSSLKIIQDKGLQKEFYKKHRIKTAPYTLCSSKAQVLDLLARKKITYPFVQKLRTAGYDGRGVAVIRKPAELPKLLDGACVIEKKIGIRKEISVIVARNRAGQVSAFPAVEMVFDQQANLVRYLVCPAALSTPLQRKASALARKVAAAFDIVGLLAVEIFISTNGDILVNEVAPRPHNSGHHTIESAFTSQYEQHLRAILGLPLGSAAITTPSVMLNILGEPGYSGPVKYQGIEKCMKVPGARIHLYGKSETHPFRKMGHITILDNSLAGAKRKAMYIYKHLKVIA